MGNKWDEMRDAVQEAQNIIKAADSMVADMAKMIVGRLHTINTTYPNTRILKDLKTELRGFNMNTRRWKK